MINITLPNKQAADAVSEALAYVWREVMDRDTSGKGACLRAVLDQLNKHTDSCR